MKGNKSGLSMIVALLSFNSQVRFSILDTQRIPEENVVVEFICITLGEADFHGKYGQSVSSCRLLQKVVGQEIFGQSVLRDYNFFRSCFLN